MRAIVQRVAWARVTVDGAVVGRCGQGLLALVGAHKNDTEAKARKLADKVVGMRIFNDEEGKMNLSLKDIEPSPEPQILAISNFTVYGDPLKSRRPSFVSAAPYDEGEKLFGQFVEEIGKLGYRVETGVFGAHMDVELLNDGPVTLVVEV